jgi:hypothetical protein
MVNFAQFQRKVDGKDKVDGQTISDTTAELGSLQCQGILTVVRARGYSIGGMEERPEFPAGVTEAWQRGLRGAPLGMYGEYPNAYLSQLLAIWIVAKQIRRYSHSEQQGGFSPDADPLGESDRVAPVSCARPYIYNGELYSGSIPSRRPIPTVGSSSRNTLAREEPSGADHWADDIGWTEYDVQRIRSALSEQERRVQSLRSEREGSERGEENPIELIRRCMERSTRG